MPEEERNRFARWVLSASDDELREYLQKRKQNVTDKDLRFIRLRAKAALIQQARAERDKDGPVWVYHYAFEEFRKRRFEM